VPDEPVLTRRALNRALLARQHLLERSTMTALGMVEHLVGIQAQNPQDPYTGLWSRIEGFRPDDLSAAIEGRQAVRMGLLRTTLHLVGSDDALAMWPVLDGVLERAWTSSPFRKDLEGVDVRAVVDAGRALLDASPLTMSQLGQQLSERWPDRNAKSLAYAIRFLAPIVQVPPRGLWRRTGQATWRTLDTWLARPIGEQSSPDALVLSYIAAFGPASIKDIATWSWLTAVRAVVDRLRPQLVTFRDAAGRELFDLPHAPRPSEDLPAPPRFLPEYDNVALSHDDRSRVFVPEAAGQLTGWVGTFTVDGFIAGQWRLDRQRSSATLVLQPFTELGGEAQDDLLAEGERLLAFQAPDATERRIEFGVARAAVPDAPRLRVGAARSSAR
jgi:hypothetical protein